MSAITSSIRTFSNRGSCYGERAGEDLSAAHSGEFGIVLCEPILKPRHAVETVQDRHP
jgi:hypothetical protein